MKHQMFRENRENGNEIYIKDNKELDAKICISVNQLMEMGLVSG
jgi:hypothetical protein